MYEEGETIYDINFIDGGIQFSDEYSKTLIFNDIIEIKIVTTDKGPWLPDIFWVLKSPDITITVEGDAPFFPILLVQLQKINGFDNDQVIKAMQSIDWAEFIILKK